MKNIVFALGFSAMITAPAFAADVIGGMEPTTISITTDGCKAVTVSRPDVTKPNFELTFRNVDIAAMQKCAADARATPNGVAVRVTFKRTDVNTEKVGTTQIKVPDNIKDGEVHNARCVPDANGLVADAVLYRTSWNGEKTPDMLPLQVMSRDFYDVEALKQQCKALIPSNR
ncbi:MAG: hypothetical protein JWO50_205 [Candidatus Kaiserbacteria bacterium]|nr:hypothetical protein [Candidatus Kaiserbacteria bacterium]